MASGAFWQNYSGWWCCCSFFSAYYYLKRLLFLFMHEFPFSFLISRYNECYFCSFYLVFIHFLISFCLSVIQFLAYCFPNQGKRIFSFSMPRFILVYDYYISFVWDFLTFLKNNFENYVFFGNFSLFNLTVVKLLKAPWR